MEVAMKGQFKEPRRINPNPLKKTTLAEVTDLVKREEEARQAEQARKTARLREKRLRREASPKE
jgi:hypothetical protein